MGSIMRITRVAPHNKMFALELELHCGSRGRGHDSLMQNVLIKTPSCQNQGGSVTVYTLKLEYFSKSLVKNRLRI